MNHPQFLLNVWKDPRFQALTQPVQLLVMGAIAQADIAGWWAPHPRLLAAEIPGLDLATALPQVKPWLQIHPTGYLSVRGYVAMQAPQGLKTESGFVKGLRRVLFAHRDREVSAGASLESIEGLNLSEAKPTGALDPAPESDDLDGHSGATPKAPRGHESPKPQVLSPKTEVESPTRGSGGEPITGPLPCPTDDTKLQGLLGFYPLYGYAIPLDQPLWALQTLQRAAQATNWARVQAATEIIFRKSAPAVPSLADLARAMDAALVAACPHPEAKRRYWTTSLHKDLPASPKQRHWACGEPGCRHHETFGAPWDPEHTCEFTRKEGRAWLLQQDGQDLVAVEQYRECTLCGRQTHAEELTEVGS